MPRSVAVISMWSAPLISKLTEVLPSVHFIEVQPLDPSPLKDAEIIVGDYNLFGPYLYDLPKVKWIQGTWAGLDFLWPHIKKQNPPIFPITRTSGENFGQLMGEYVIGNIVFWERNYFMLYYLIFGRRDKIPLQDKEYSHLAKYYSRPNLSELLSNVDYIINILPSTDETMNILGNEILQNCKGKNVVFINIGRANVIKETELIRALDKKWISGAILDVFETEPLPRDSRLWDFNNVFITPHISGNSRTLDIAMNFKNNFEKFVNNQPLVNQIDFVKGY